MHKNTLKKLALALTFWLALHVAALKAQILGPYGTSPYTFGVDSNGLLTSTGSFGTGTLSLSGSGTKMFWYPGKGAFRAGGVTSGFSTIWNDANIGAYSTAFGFDTTASGQNSFAAGSVNTASGDDSVAMGNGCKASNTDTVAIGFACTASGKYSSAIGVESFAVGYASTASGDAYASGSLSTATELGTASGDYSTASGYCTVAVGYSSTASGNYTTASSDMSFVIGAYNLGLSSAGSAANPTAWVSSDPLFEIGNGTSTRPSDAFVVYKNGNVTAQGVITAAPGGDIPMYSGN